MTGKISRRTFMATTSALTLANATGKAAEEKTEPGSQPNVLIIHADQHRLDCLGAYGNAEIHTPNLDALAKDGILFRNSFCPYPVCTPSRYSLLTGLYVHEHRGWSNHCTLPPGTDTIPGILKEAGYKTKAVGKMHFTPTYFDLGFEELELAEQNGLGRWDDDYHRDLRDQGLVDLNDLEDQERMYRKDARPEYRETFGALASNLPEEYHSTRWIGDRAVETIEQWEASGNMLMVGFIKPHHPMDPPKRLCDAYDPASLTILPGWTEECLPEDQELSKGYFDNASLTTASLRHVMAYYYATIQQIDEEAGRMIDVLRRKGIYDNTLIVYTADHGDYMGFHHMILKGNYMYDPLVKVPLIIKYPDSRDKGTVSDSLVNNVDLAPTILNQAGCRVGSRMTGCDLAKNGEGSPVVFSEHQKGMMAMARTKTRKLIAFPRRKKAFLYDLEKDPYEMTNCYDDPAYRKDVRELTKALDEWRSFDTLPPMYLDEDAPVIDQPNVPSRKDKHREEMQAYCREKVAELLKK